MGRWLHLDHDDHDKGVITASPTARATSGPARISERAATAGTTQGHATPAALAVTGLVTPGKKLANGHPRTRPARSYPPTS